MILIGKNATLTVRMIIYHSHWIKRSLGSNWTKIS